MMIIIIIMHLKKKINFIAYRATLCNCTISITYTVYLLRPKLPNIIVHQKNQSTKVHGKATAAAAGKQKERKPNTLKLNQLTLTIIMGLVPIIFFSRTSTSDTCRI